jgi:hypothetical protein
VFGVGGLPNRDADVLLFEGGAESSEYCRNSCELIGMGDAEAWRAYLRPAVAGSG